jgi:DNA invertase Pin-like site-specific DNA recombinase
LKERDRRGYRAKRKKGKTEGKRPRKRDKRGTGGEEKPEERAVERNQGG